MDIAPYQTAPTARPTKGPDESWAEFRQRERAWIAQSGAIGATPTLGIPGPVVRTLGEAPAGAAPLVAFGGATLPTQPANMRPPPDRRGPPPFLPPPPPGPGSLVNIPVALERNVYYPMQSPAPDQVAPRFATPGSALPPGLRKPAAPSAAEQQRLAVLEATGFDLRWGSPPTSPWLGMRWNPNRFLYEGVASTGPAPGIFQGLGPILVRAAQIRSLSTSPYWEGGYFLQAYRHSTGLDWWLRWVQTNAPSPAPDHPYRVLTTAEGAALEARLGNRSRLVSSVPLPR